MKIAIGIARGLKYLHTELNPPLTISELNSGSVYLTDDFSPKVLKSWPIFFSPILWILLHTVARDFEGLLLNFDFRCVKTFSLYILVKVLLSEKKMTLLFPSLAG